MELFGERQASEPAPAPARKAAGGKAVAPVRRGAAPSPERRAAKADAQAGAAHVAPRAEPLVGAARWRRLEPAEQPLANGFEIYCEAAGCKARQPWGMAVREGWAADETAAKRSRQYAGYHCRPCQERLDAAATAEATEAAEAAEDTQ